MMKIGVAMVAIALLGFASSATAGESCGFMRSLISSTFGSHEDVWMCIAFHESSFNPDARNPFSGATGLFQVEPIHCGDPGCPSRGSNCVRELEDPDTNARCAKSVYDSQGFGAWTTYGSCASGGNNPCGGAEAAAPCASCDDIANCNEFGGGYACYTKFGCDINSC